MSRSRLQARECESQCFTEHLSCASARSLTFWRKDDVEIAVLDDKPVDRLLDIGIVESALAIEVRVITDVEASFASHERPGQVEGSLVDG